MEAMVNHGKEKNHIFRLVWKKNIKLKKKKIWKLKAWAM
jgi:hypothetical protein